MITYFIEVQHQSNETTIIFSLAFDLSGKWVDINWNSWTFKSRYYGTRVFICFNYI